MMKNGGSLLQRAKKGIRHHFCHSSPSFRFGGHVLLNGGGFSIIISWLRSPKCLILNYWEKDDGDQTNLGETVSSGTRQHPEIQVMLTSYVCPWFRILCFFVCL